MMTTEDGSVSVQLQPQPVGHSRIIVVVRSVVRQEACKTCPHDRQGDESPRMYVWQRAQRGGGVGRRQ